MIKPKGEITYGGFQPGLIEFYDVKEINIAEWCPDLEAKQPPEQVHMRLQLVNVPYPIVVRFKSPDTIGFLIEELAKYRRNVWPNSEKVKT